MFICFDTIHERDRHTQRQTPYDDIGRACITSRGKNCPILIKFGAQKRIPIKMAFMHFIKFNIVFGHKSAPNYPILVNFCVRMKNHIGLLITVT